MDEPISFQAIELSEEAANKITEIKENSNIDKDFSVRVRIIEGGLAGFQYNLSLISQDEIDHDKCFLFSSRGHQIVVEKKDKVKLCGTLLHWDDSTTDRRSWIYQNPNIREAEL